MVQVVKKDEETFDETLRRFRRKVKRDQILSEVRRHMYYEKPSEKRKREARTARRRLMKRLKKRGK